MTKNVYTLSEVAQAITSGNLTAAAKLINDAGMIPRLAEIRPDPGAFIPRTALNNLVVMRPGSREGRIAAELLKE
jgi:hypothetical protein